MDGPAAKAPEIEKAGMRADADAIVFCPLERAMHHQGIPGVEPTGDVGGGNDLEHAGVIAERIDAKSFAHVAVDVDHSHRAPPIRSPHRLLR
jgi:hypothetical protein